MIHHNNIVSFDKARTSRVRGFGAARAEGMDRYAGLDYYEQRYGSLDFEQAKRARTRRTTQQRTRNSARKGSATDAHSYAAGKLERAKRLRAKAKAQRAFTKQYGKLGDNSADSSAATQSRPAVYQGKMGSVHRRSMHLQEKPEGTSSKRAKRFSLAGVSAWVAASLKKPGATVCASLLICLVLAGAYLYPSAREYYQAFREQARLELEYQAVSERNEALAATVESLQSESGIEARARSQYGWVMEGEQMARVSGIDAQDADADISEKVNSEDIKPPTTWYSALLDPLFGVES